MALLVSITVNLRGSCEAQKIGHGGAWQKTQKAREDSMESVG